MTEPDDLAAVLAYTRALKPEDTHVDDIFDVDPTYTLVAHPPAEVAQRIVQALEKLRACEPDHYYASPDEFHVTLLGPGRVQDISIDQKAIAELLPPPLKVQARGPAFSPHGASVVAYPLTSGLQESRENLRALYGRVVDFSKYNPIFERLMWMNLVRLSHVPSEEFVKLLSATDNNVLGEFVIDQWELYIVSSKLLDEGRRQHIATLQAPR